MIFDFQTLIIDVNQFVFQSSKIKNQSSKFMSIQILKTGILSTVQDTGRNGYRRFGINPNGAMDRTAARLIEYFTG